MLGVVVGDVLGSTYERRTGLPRSSALPEPGARFTDDTVFTLATAQALLDSRDLVACYQDWGRRYAEVGASRRFSAWLESANPKPYQGDTNGALMRVSPAIALTNSLDDALATAQRVTEITHDHPRALAAVEAYARALWSALAGSAPKEACGLLRLSQDEGLSLDELHVQTRFRMKAAQTLADVRECLLDADSFESTIRNALYCGGDVDTLCAVAGPLAECFWGVPAPFEQLSLDLLPLEGLTLLERQYRHLARRWGPRWAATAKKLAHERERRELLTAASPGLQG